MPKRGLKRSRRGKRKGKQSLASMYYKMIRATSQRVYRSAQGAAYSTTSTVSAFPIRMGCILAYWDPTGLAAVLDDTGVGSVALASPYTSNTNNGKIEIYGLKSTHTFRNAALNPVFYDIWVLTPTKNVSYQKTTATTYDTLTEQIMYDLYVGWAAKYLSTDLTGQLKQSDATTAWGGAGDVYTNSVNFTPGMSDDFTRHWRILKHHAVMLNPGQSFVFNDTAKSIKDWQGTIDQSTFRIGHPGTARILLYRQRGAVGYNGASQGYCTTNVVYQGNFEAKVAIAPTNTKIVATTAASLPAASTISGIGDDAVVA